MTFPVSTNDGATTVGATSILIFPARYGKRLDYSIVNTGATNLSIRRGIGAAVTKEGIYLVGLASFWGESSGDVEQCWQGEIQIISDAGGGTFAYSERLRD